MFITDDTKALSARKDAQAFHRNHKIKSINDVVPHKLDWATLGKLKRDAGIATRDILDGITDSTDAPRRASAEASVDAFVDLSNALDAEKDTRTAEGSREPRSEAVSASIRDKRPTYGLATTEHAPEETAIALRSDQSFRSWATARGDAPESIRGMNAGQFLRAMVVSDKSEMERRALSEATDSAGGFTVPDVLSAELIDKARAQSVVMRAGAQTVPLTSDSNTIAKVLTDPTPGWRNEAAAVANEDATFGAVVLTSRSLAVAVDISAELMADSLNLSVALPNILAAAFAVELDRVALIGSGSAPQPRGVLNTIGIGTFAQDGVSANYSNLSKARTGILTANRGPVSAYVMHPRDEGRFVDLVDSDGQPLRAPDAVAQIPILTTTSLPVDGGAGSDESTIFAGNFAHLLVGIRSGVQIELFKGPKYISNLQYTMVAHLRADIAVQDPKAFFTLTGVGQA